jgi:hypothetical protein
VGARVAAAVKIRKQLEGVAGKTYGVVPGHRALILEAQHSLQTEIGVRRSIGRALLGRRHAETGVEAGKEGSEELVSLLQRAGACQTELCHQAVLEGAPQPLDAPFGLPGGQTGLRREGKDRSDAQLVKGPAELSGLALPPDLSGLLQGFQLLGGALEDAVAVAVESKRDPFPLDDLSQQQEIALGIFLLPKESKGNYPGGVIDGPD